MAKLTKDQLDDLAIENFRRYLRIPSVQPDVNYDDCVAFITEQAEEIGLQWTIYEYVERKPIVVVKWEGTDPLQPSILLNSHMDVVPVFPENWHHDPFGAEMDEDGNIYARGAQDTKNIAIQYLEAIRRLILNGQKNKRNVYISFVPDEEIGGIGGMITFATTQDFKDLNVGCAFDEGSSSPNETYELHNGERTIWKVEFKVSGTEGHGSLLLKETAGEKLRRLLDKIMDYRQSQVDILDQNPDLVVGDVTTVNLTILKGGVQINVVPPEFSATFDVRIALSVGEDDFDEMLRKWCEESGEGIEINYITRNQRVEPTKLDDSNPYWIAMKKEMDDMGLTLHTFISAGGADSQEIRKLGIPALNFSPVNNTIPLIHADDEYLNKDVFLKGIEIYQRIITAEANI